VKTHYITIFKVLFIVVLLCSSVTQAQDKPNKLGFKKTFIEVTEGDVIDILVELDSASKQDISFDYSLKEIEARASRDFLDTSSTGTLSISAGETSTTITINIVDNSKTEEEESFRIFLSNPLIDGQSSESLELSFRKALTVLILDNDISSDSVLRLGSIRK